ncbi:hypothetical protein SAMN06265795_12254 [Noviherbaspirillum humi]|uniref:Uncharacterized protein n=1 Tax=Noviherbaspirillum humi TaxID=1688639 RepID=A0A239LFM8_9BURK|nr:hypothetical protein [Noviherbaspirillum humi]SNT29145.1 hypothetical protein SAMN06265795_12254 [Noviherbaspirillum humi]
MIGLQLVAGCFAGAYLLWLFYLAVMSLQRARDAGTIPRPAYLLGLPILYLGLVIDFACNVMVASLLFLELPREWLVSARVSRHCRSGVGWRGTLGCWICHSLLDAFDPSGRHCK